MTISVDTVFLHLLQLSSDTVSLNLSTSRLLSEINLSVFLLFVLQDYLFRIKPRNLG